MINLIPDQIRINNRYALRNVKLVKYTAVSILAMISIMAMTGLSILNMNNTESDLQKQSAEQQQKIAAYKPLQDRGTKLSTELSTVNTLLDRQVTFSELIPKIAKLTPPGAVLTELDFSTSDILGGSAAKPVGGAAAQKPFIIQAAVTNRNVAATLLENIKASKDLFTDADLVSVSQATKGTSPDPNALPTITAKYPYQVTINAYLKKINTTSSTSQSWSKQ